MRSFSEILDIAMKRHGSLSAVEARLPAPLSPDALRSVPDDRWLSMMAKDIFRAGFNWSVIDQKWDAFETAFAGFEPGRLLGLPEDETDRLFSDSSIVRNGAKINATLENARFVTEIAEEYGSFGNFVADWPLKEHDQLLETLSKRGSRLGAGTGQRFLRHMGRDGYVMTPDVVTRLCEEAVIEKAPSSKRAMAAVQEAFNTWMDQSGRGLSQISQVLALSV